MDVFFEQLVKEYKAEYLRVNGYEYDKEIKLVNGWIEGWSYKKTRVKELQQAIGRFKARLPFEQQELADRKKELEFDIEDMTIELAKLKAELADINNTIANNQK